MIKIVRRADRGINLVEIKKKMCFRENSCSTMLLNVADGYTSSSSLPSFLTKKTTSSASQAELARHSCLHLEFIESKKELVCVCILHPTNMTRRLHGNISEERFSGKQYSHVDNSTKEIERIRCCDWNLGIAALNPSSFYLSQHEHFANFRAGNFRTWVRNLLPRILMVWKSGSWVRYWPQSNNTILRLLVSRCNHFLYTSRR